MECDYDPIFPVCGPNWKTYRSMCHALYCGDLRIEDVKEGSCDTMVSKNKFSHLITTFYAMKMNTMGPLLAKNLLNIMQPF